MYIPLGHFFLYGSLYFDSLINSFALNMKSKTPVYIHTEILPSYKKEFMIATCKNMKESENNYVNGCIIPPNKRSNNLHNFISVKF